MRTLPVLDEIASVPVSLQMLKPAADRANPKIGIGALAFSPDSYFLATRNGQQPWARAVHPPTHSPGGRGPVLGGVHSLLPFGSVGV